MRLWKLIKMTWREFRHDRAGAQAAALAYYAMFAMAPTLLIAIGVSGLVLGEQVAREELLSKLEGVVGPRAQETVARVVAELSETVRSVASIVAGSVALVFGASGVFAQVHDSMNAMWGIKPDVHPIRGIWLFVRKRLLSFVLVVLTGVVFLVSLASSTLVTAEGGWLERQLNMSGPALVMTDFLTSLVLIALVVCLILKYLPDAAIHWRYAASGSIFISLLLNVGKLLFGVYLSRSLLISAYGAAGSLIVLLIWLYYSGMMFYLGVEFTQVIARLDGRPIEPSKWVEQ